MSDNEYRCQCKEGFARYSTWFTKTKGKQWMSPGDVDAIINNLSTGSLLLIEAKPVGYDMVTDSLGQMRSLAMHAENDRRDSLVVFCDVTKNGHKTMASQFQVWMIQGFDSEGEVIGTTYEITLPNFQKIIEAYCKKGTRDKPVDVEALLNKYNVMTLAA